MVISLLILFTLLFLTWNIYYFFSEQSYQESFFSRSLFFKLFFVLTALTIGFALLYYLLGFNEVVLRINDPTGEPANATFLDYLYFSGVTILSVGYGDFVPVGRARFFSLIQASCGLLLPAAYFLKVYTSSKANKS
ncbi:potassium channel family protein [Bacillus shivajii]|uniref:potassium channel family protein n=1 Tax=Bacillus shivajii TaxID=1983719 RepID=UPI001CF9AB38|nr:potassium channel family protein [Bacillus shivajii]UCZ53773.1 potassium channel family protein [Bacillus shivajii]